MTTEAVIFSDVHASDADPAGAARLEAFLRGEAAGAGRVYILGDLFDFWFGPRQAGMSPYREILDRLAALAASGVKVTLFHGNRDFYVDDALARRYGFTVVSDYSIETICGMRVHLSHGDMLCSNDVNYHRMRAIVRHPAAAWAFKRMPARWAEALARLSRRGSKKAVAAKAQWVLGIDDAAVERAFALGADAVVAGHTHRQGMREFPAAGGKARRLYTLGDFGSDGSYIAVGEGGMEFKVAGDTQDGL